MNTKEAWALVGGLSKPSKMPGWSIGIPAKECKTGAKLRLIPDSVCYKCYALKGCYVFQVVQAAQYKRLEAISHPDWVQAMTTLINSKKPDVFRWHDSGDVQDEAHLNKIFEVCRATPSKRHWMPTRPDGQYHQRSRLDHHQRSRWAETQGQSHHPHHRETGPVRQ